MAADITGQRFGRLVALRQLNRKASNGCWFWLCQCDCGNAHEVARNSLLQMLKKGNPCSCGCARKGCNATHGLSRSPEMKVWAAMRQRCENPRSPGYLHYGARGISVCDRWRESFAAFLADVGFRPSAGHSIDRIDVNGNYEPGNCRWATLAQQSRNKRTSKLSIDDVDSVIAMHTSGVCARDIASKFCVSRGLVHQTIHRWRRGELEVTRFRDDLASVAGAVGR